MNIVQYLTPELATFLSSLLPGLELRVGIPIGITMGLPVWQAFVIGVIGSIAPAFFILKFLNPATKFLRKHSSLADKFFTNLFDKTRNKHKSKFEKYGSIFLIIFVAIPLPGSGVWTGSLIAYLFGVKYWKSIALISIGSLIAGILVATGFGSIFAIWKHFF